MDSTPHSDAGQSSLPQPVKTVSASPQVAVEQKSPVPLGSITFLSEVAKFSVLTGFALYLIGFIIWHSFLSKFGVSPQSFLQVNFISAALCFLAVCGVFIVPALLLIDSFLAKPELPQKNAVRFTILLCWNLALTWVSPLFFPDLGPYWPLSLAVLQFLVICAFLIHIGILVYLCRKSKIESIWAAVWGLQAALFYLVLCQIVIIIKNSHGTVLLICCLGLPAFGPEGYGSDMKAFWAHERPNSRLFAATILSLFVIWCAYAFGLKSFGKIPRSVGGGQPEVVLIKLSDTQKTLASLLALTTTNELVGPLALINQSDNSLTVIPVAQFQSAFDTTNRVYAREIPRSSVDGIFYQDVSVLSLDQRVRPR